MGVGPGEEKDLHLNNPVVMLLIMVCMFFFLMQFFVYMGYAAWMYPYVCKFTLFSSGTQYKGADVHDFENGETEPMTRMVVDCDDVFLLNWVKDGREFFQVMAHLFPILFGFAFHFTFAGSLPLLDMRKVFLDLVDVQDFYALLMEDDLLRNAWGRDMCDDGFLGLPQYRCSGKFNTLWYVIFGLFVAAACQITARTILKSLYSAFSYQALRKDMKGNDEDDQIIEEWILNAVGRKGPRALFKRFKFLEHFTTIICLDLPFLCIRCMCSYRYCIFQNTLLIKNFFCVCLSVAALLQQTSRYQDILVNYPMLHALTSAWEDLAQDYLGLSPEDGNPAEGSGPTSRTPTSRTPLTASRSEMP